MGARKSGGKRRLSSEPWRVFLSHTSDLAELPKDRTFVAAAQSAVLRAGDAVTDMSYFTARDNAPADYCERMVSQAAVYVAIVGHRYGSPVRGRPDRSYTELEYDVATRLGLPRLIFMTRDGSSPSTGLDQPGGHAARQDEFRRRLLDESDVTVAWITTPADLELSLYQALTELRREQSAHRYPNNLLRLRGKGRSQEEVAHSVGVSTSTYQTWEYGDRLPYPVNVKALCDYFGVDEPALGFGVVIGDDSSREMTTANPGAESAAPPPPPLRAVNELVEWLAAATGKPADDLDLLVRRRVSQLSGNPTSRRRSRSAGRQQRAEELTAYYGRDDLLAHGLSPYALTLAGRTLSLSIATRTDWRGCSVELVNPTASNPTQPGERCALVAAPPIRTPWAAAMDRAVTLLARAEIGAQTGDGPIILNKPLYRLVDVQLERDRLNAKFAIDWFAHYALSCDLLEAELSEVAARPHGDQPSADLVLPLRDELMNDAAAVAAYQDRLCAGGIIALFVVARPASWDHEADFLIVVQKRSHRVLNLQGSLTVIPRGFHQHMRDARGEVSLGATVYREVEEELLGRDDFDESTGRERLGVTAHHVDRLTEPMRWLSDHDAVSVQCVALGMNLVTGNYEFACLICVPNEDFWTLHGGACLPNWEAADIQTHSSLDPDGLRELILDDTWTDGGLFALLEGLRRLADQYPERVRLPDLEWLI
jgi:transcriptional regulator with XRE-family HTH domain